MLKVKSLNKRVGNLSLSDISFNLEEGATLGILGPSGSGKTTLLRMLMGLETADSGEIVWKGRALSNATAFVPPEKRNFGLVPQDASLFPHLTVQRNVSFGLQGMSREDKEKTSREWCKKCNIDEIRDRGIHLLSGGEAQRTALARSLAREPELLLLDEPFSSVDRMIRHDLITTIKSVVQTQNTTMILVTHDARDAVDFCTHLCLFRAGRIIKFGKLADVMNDPGDAWGREYISHGIGTEQRDV